MKRKIPFPPPYKNTAQSLGGVVSDIIDTSESTFHLYEVNYDRIREALETLRKADKLVFLNVVDFILDPQCTLSSDQKVKAGKILKQSGLGLENSLLSDVVRDWARHSPALDESYRPSFSVDIGRPVRKSYFAAVAQRIEKIRDNAPEFANDLDKLLTSGDPTGVIFAESWYGRTYPDKELQVARRFAWAVKDLDILDFDAAKTYCKLSPAGACVHDRESEPS